MRKLTVLLTAAALAWASLPAAHAADDQKVEVGKPAPPIDLPAANVGKALPGKADAKTLSLADLKGKNVVLYFFPKAMTPGCTRQSCGFRDLSKDFAKYDTVVVGISTDRLAEQNKFTEKESLNFPLLADADKKVAREYGVLSDRGFARRATFVIDKQGIVRKIYPSANADKNPQEVLDYVKNHLEKK
jgi:thioredoxin-dependent peroxiredoxin